MVTSSRLNVDFLQLSVQVVELEDLAHKEVAISVRYLGVSDMNHVVVDVKVQLDGDDRD